LSPEDVASVGGSFTGVIVIVAVDSAELTVELWGSTTTYWKEASISLFDSGANRRSVLPEDREMIVPDDPRDIEAPFDCHSVPPFTDMILIELGVDPLGSYRLGTMSLILADSGCGVSSFMLIGPSPIGLTTVVSPPALG
jgi:hypothetical protein